MQDRVAGISQRTLQAYGCQGITMRCKGTQSYLIVLEANYECKGIRLVDRHLTILKHKCDKKTTCEVPSPDKTLACQSSVSDIDKTLSLTYICTGFNGGVDETSLDGLTGCGRGCTGNGCKGTSE